jgi:carnitine-CoA ligase
MAPIYEPTRAGDVPAADDDAGQVALDPERVLPRRVAWWAGREPDRTFLQEVTGLSLTYGQAWQRVLRWAGWLTQLGLRRGDRLVTMLPASADAVLAWLAAGVLGVIEVPVNPELRGEFLTHVLTDSAARLALVRPEFEPLLAGCAIPVVTAERDADLPPNAAAPDGYPEVTDPACVIYTSGTTGPAKGVVLSWAQFTANIGRIPRSWLSGDDAVYCPHPMFHVTGRSPVVVMADVGGRVVLRERFSASAFLSDVRAFGCTSTTVQCGLVLATPESADDADNPLRIAYAGHNVALARRFGARFGVHVIDAYGSTEAGFPITRRWTPDGTGNRCGRLRHGYQARVVDPDGKDVPDGTPGELWIMPPARPLVMLEYLRRPDVTAAAFADEWYRTGDVVIRHPDGEFQFVDRKRDTIRRLGENISASAVESVVATDPDVADCAVLGVPDPVAGHEVLLAVVPRDRGDGDGAFDPSALYARLSGRLPRYALPEYIVTCAALPKTPTHKVRKDGLLETLDTGSAWRPPSRRPVATRDSRLTGNPRQLMPQSRNTASASAPGLGGPSGMPGAVRENRGAGAAWRTPSISVIVPRPARCG